MSAICFINTDVMPLKGDLLIQYLCDLEWTDSVGVRLHFYYDGDTERDDQATRLGGGDTNPTIGWWDLQDHTLDFSIQTPSGKVTANVLTKIYGDCSDVIQVLYPFVDGDNCCLYHVNSAGVRPLVFARAICQGNASRQPPPPPPVEIDPIIDHRREEQTIQTTKLKIIADLSWIDSAHPAQLCAYIREQALQQGERICAEYNGVYTGKLEVEWADRLLAVRNAT